MTGEDIQIRTLIGSSNNEFSRIPMAELQSKAFPNLRYTVGGPKAVKKLIKKLNQWLVENQLLAVVTGLEADDE